MVERPKCSKEGCINLVAYDKREKGYYKKLCTSHHRRKYGISNLNWEDRQRRLIPNNKCIQCGWDGPCDRHRVEQGKDGGRYKRENVLVLCPNCHRLLHFKEWGYIKG